MDELSTTVEAKPTPSIPKTLCRGGSEPARAQCPAPPVQCGEVDGVLWQVARPWARLVRAHEMGCEPCRADRDFWLHDLTSWERVLASWRRVPVRARLLLAVACLLLAFGPDGAYRRHRVVSHQYNWSQCPSTGHWYMLGGRYDRYGEAVGWARWWSQGYLATVGSEAEWAWIHQRMILDREVAENVYLGLREVRQHGNWQWVTGEPLDYAAWAEGQPAHPTDERLRVAVVGEDGRWQVEPVPARPDEPPSAGHAVIEREADPFGVLPGWLRLTLLLSLLGLALLMNSLLVLIARRQLVIRLEVSGSW